MKRLIIHPQDRSTDFLAAIYKDWDDVELHREKLTSHELQKLFHHCPESTQILLLGHGCGKGLFYRDDDNKNVFHLYVSHTHSYYLREHRNTIGVFCFAEQFASEEGLHGFFSGMYISELPEARFLGINATAEEIENENDKFVTRFRQLLDEECPLSDIPARMLAMDDAQSELTKFNYYNLYYL